MYGVEKCTGYSMLISYDKFLIIFLSIVDLKDKNKFSVYGLSCGFKVKKTRWTMRKYNLKHLRHR